MTTLLSDHRLEQTDIKSPFVTVIVTNYNYDRYIVSCLKSIAGQTYRSFNCVIVDDCSSDHSVELIQEFIGSGFGIQSSKVLIFCQ